MSRERKIICPKCGAVLAIEKQKDRKIIHIKGSKSEIYADGEGICIVCNSKRRDNRHREICGQKVVIKLRKEDIIDGNCK